MLNISHSCRTVFGLDFRRKQAWGVFYKLKNILFDQNVSLNLRLKLFDACCTPVALFGLSVLSLTVKDRKVFDILQRRMLRRIIGWRRSLDDT